MNVQEELKALKQRIAELEYHAKQERDFPQDGDEYWYIDDEGGVFSTFYDNNHYIDGCHQDIGNIFKTKEEAEFVVEKLKVEAELRKFSRPFEEDENNYFIELHLFDKTLLIGVSENFQKQGVIYFESEEKAQQAASTVGFDRIKKYIFGVED